MERVGLIGGIRFILNRDWKLYATLFAGSLFVGTINFEYGVYLLVMYALMAIVMIVVAAFSSKCEECENLQFPLVGQDLSTKKIVFHICRSCGAVYKV